jgi:hypothetical protein
MILLESLPSVLIPVFFLSENPKPLPEVCERKEGHELFR